MHLSQGLNWSRWVFNRFTRNLIKDGIDPQLHYPSSWVPGRLRARILCREPILFRAMAPPVESFRGRELLAFGFIG